MELVKPDLGTLFWMLVSFLIVLFLLSKFAWKPILNMLKNREDSIEKALNEARIAREEIADLKSENDQILKQARIERDNLLHQAKEKGDEIINRAKQSAEEERKRIMQETREMVQKEKEMAFRELKDEISQLVIDTAAKVIGKELKSPEEHKSLIAENLKEL